MKTFKLYADGSQAEDSGEADIEGADYDSNYEEDYSPNWNDYVADSSEPTESVITPGFQNSVKGEELKNASSLDQERVAVLAVLHKVEGERGQEFEKSVHETHQNIARDRLLEPNRQIPSHKNERNGEAQHFHSKEDHPKRRRAVAENTERSLFSDFPNDRNQSSHENDLAIISVESRSARKRKNRILNTYVEISEWDHSR